MAVSSKLNKSEILPKMFKEFLHMFVYCISTIYDTRYWFYMGQIKSKPSSASVVDSGYIVYEHVNKLFTHFRQNF